MASGLRATALAVAAELFEERKRALEEEYFRKLNADLVDHLRAEAQEAVQAVALEKASGIADRALLDELLHLGITPETLPAFALVPLIEVAWGGETIDDGERDALLSDSGAAALEPGSAAGAPLRQWLAERPTRELFRAWSEFTRAVCALLAPGLRLILGREMVRRATAVAKASGGLTGILATSSPEEHQAIERVRAEYKVH